MHSGTVQWFDDRTGVGAILLEDGTTASVARSQIDGGGVQSLRAGEEVRFDLRRGPDGAEAVAVYTR